MGDMVSEILTEGKVPQSGLPLSGYGIISPVREKIRRLYPVIASDDFVDKCDELANTPHALRDYTIVEEASGFPLRPICTVSLYSTFGHAQAAAAMFKDKGDDRYLAFNTPILFKFKAQEGL